MDAGRLGVFVLVEIDISNKVKKLIMFGLPGLILLAVLVSSIFWYAKYGSDDYEVRDAKVASSMVSTRVRVSGTVSEILVEDGAAVKAGDVIAKVKVNVTDEQLKQLQQTVDLSQRNLEQLKQGIVVTTPRTVESYSGASSAEVERLRSRMERMNELYDMGAISAVKRDEAVAEYQSALAMSSAQSSVTYDTTVQEASPEVIKRAELQLRQAQVALETAKGNASATEITAPVDGTVALGELTVGQEVQAGDIIASVGTSDSMWIEAYIDTDDVDKVRLGQGVDYYVDRIKYTGLVTEIILPEENEDTSANTEGEQQSSVPTDKIIVRVSISPDDLQHMKLGNRVTARFLKNG